MNPTGPDNDEGFSFLFYAFLAYLFFLFLRPTELLAPWLEPFRPMLIIWAVAFLGSLFEVINKRHANATGLHYALLFWLWLWIGLTHFVLGQFGSGIEAIQEFSATVLLFVLISFQVRSDKRLRASAAVTVFCFLCMVGLCINAFHTGHLAEELVLQQRKDTPIEAPIERPPIPAEDTSGAFMWRVRGVGIFSDPNDFAQGLVMCMPMLGWLYRQGAWIRNLFLIGVPIAAMTYCITLTNSRGALLGIASLLFFGIRNTLGTAKTIVLLTVGGLGAMIIGATGGRGFSSKEESASGRIDAWYEGFQMLKASPIFGAGFNNFLDHHHLTAHNSFVLCFAELGLVGYFVWISLIVISFKAVNRVAQYAPLDSKERLAGNILRASLIGYLTCGWFLSRTYQPTFFALMALCTSVWMSARKSPVCANIPEIQAPMDWFKSSVQTTIGTLALVYFFIFTHHL